MNDTASQNGGMRIGPVHYERFGPFENVEMDFSVPGITTIEAVIANVRGCNSNGGGKSMLIDGICWCAYGRSVRSNFSGDDVISLNSTGGTRVTFDLVGGPEPIKIRRHRKWTGFLEDGKSKGGDRVQVWVGGKETTRGNNPMTDAYIADELLGMDFLAFVNAIAFGTRDDVKGFFTADDESRKSVLEMILGLSLYGAGEKVARQRMKLNVISLNKLDGDISGANLAAEGKRSLAEKLSGSDEVRDIELEVNKLLLIAKKANKEKDVSASKVTTAQMNVKQAKGAYDGQMEKYKKAKVVCDEMRTDRLALKQQCLKEEALADGKANALKDALKTLEGIGKECPTCKQGVDAKHVKKMAAAIQKQIDKLGQEADAANMEAEQYGAEIDNLIPPEIPVRDELTAAEMELNQRTNEHTTAINVATAADKAVAAAKINHTQHTQRVAILMGEVKALEGKVEAWTAERKAMDAVTARQEFWAEGFGAQGLRSFMLEAEMPEINNRATAYAHKLLGDGATVRLLATKELKKGTQQEKMTVEGRIAGMTERFAGASNGQKHRMDLALLLAFRDLTASRATKALDQLFVDEIFDGLDQTGTEAVAALMEELAASRPVVLITHDDRLKSMGTRTVIVHHDGNPEGGRATLEIKGETPSPMASESAMIPPQQAKKAVAKKTAVKK